MQSIGEKLKAERLRRGLTQKEVCIASGLAPNVVSMFERGSVQTLKNLTAYLSGIDCGGRINSDGSFYVIPSPIDAPSPKAEKAPETVEPSDEW